MTQPTDEQKDQSDAMHDPTMKYPKPYYCPTCVEFFDFPGDMFSCVNCGENRSDSVADCECGDAQVEMQCPKCLNFGDEMGLDHAEAWKKDIEAKHPELLQDRV